MRLTERQIRYRVRRVMLESYSAAFDIAAEDYARIESLWSKAVDIMASLENYLIDKHSAGIAEYAKEELGYLADRLGIEEEHVREDEVARYDLLETVEDFASDLLVQDQNISQEMKRLDSLLKLTVILFLRKSKDKDPEDQNRIAELSQDSVSRKARHAISRLAAARASAAALGLERLLVVGERQTVRQNADNTLYGVLMTVKSNAERIDDMYI